MSDHVDVAIIGAGPYGLSLAAYLREAGVEHRIFGKPMEPWKTAMPPGMLLKSHPWSSSLYDPASAFTLKQFCAERAIPYHDSLMHLPVETFVAYGEAFQQRFAPRVETKMLAHLEQSERGFTARFDDDETLTAGRVVLAVGVHPFMYLPPELERLPGELRSHSGDHGPLDGFRGKEVAILGGGSSATDLAALLHEQFVSVSLIARASELNFSGQRRTNRSFARRLAAPLRPLIQPGSGIGSGWVLKTWADAPGVFHALPASWRMNIVRNTLGPLGHTAVRDRILGVVPLHLGHDLESAGGRGGKVDLQLRRRDGTLATLRVDHVIAATGYRIDLGRIGFLAPGLRSRIRSIEKTPVLSTSYETSVPGLHIVGPASAGSFGPVARFVFGAIHPSRRLARHLARPMRERAGREPTLWAQPATSG